MSAATDRFCRSRELTPSPASIAAKLDLVARRVRSGWDFFEAVSLNYGMQAALLRRSGIKDSRQFRVWRAKGWVPEGQIFAIAKALDLPTTSLPSRDGTRLRKAGELILAGQSFQTAMRETASGAALARCLGVPRRRISRIVAVGTIPIKYLSGVALILQCEASLLPRSRTNREAQLGRQYLPEWRQRIREALSKPERREQRRAKAAKQPRNAAGTGWAKRT